MAISETVLFGALFGVLVWLFVAAEIAGRASVQGRRPGRWFVGTLVFNVVAVVAFYMTDPPETPVGQQRQRSADSTPTADSTGGRVEDGSAGDGTTGGQSARTKSGQLKAGPCAECGKELNVGVRYCPNCGTQRQPPERDDGKQRQRAQSGQRTATLEAGPCWSCGTELDAGTAYCGNCGARQKNKR